MTLEQSRKIAMIVDTFGFFCSEVIEVAIRHVLNCTAEEARRYYLAGFATNAIDGKEFVKYVEEYMSNQSKGE